MRTVLTLCFAALLCVTYTLPAQADKYVYYGDDWGWHDRHHHRGHGYGHRWRHRDRHEYRQDYHRSYYNQASYREIRCTNDYNPLGLLLGGAAGGIVGKQIGKGRGNTAAIISGAVLGSAIGSGVYQQRCDEQVFHDVPVGMPVSWRDDEEYYQITPLRDTERAGRYCREYQARATIGGRRQDTYGTACLQPDGSWEIVD